jgi:hypothetical protein
MLLGWRGQMKIGSFRAPIRNNKLIAEIDACEMLTVKVASIWICTEKTSMIMVPAFLARAKVNGEVEDQLP